MVPPFPPDDARLAALRDELPALGAGIYLDAATAGPLPAPTAAVMAELAAWELRTGRASTDFRLAVLDRLEEARAGVAAVLTADVDEIAITTSTSQAVGSAIWSVPWAPGDRAVTTTGEPAGLLGPLYALRDRLGVELVFVDAGAGDEDRLVGEFERLIAPGTRAVVISHVSPMTGLRLPVDVIAAIAHERGAIVVVDGTQAAGAIPTDAPSLGVDAYAVASRTWLLGPDGVGALWMAPRHLEGALLTWPGPRSFERLDGRGGALPWSDARRFDAADLYGPAIVGFARSLGWLTMHVGLPWCHERGPALARATADRLAAVGGVELITPPDRMATIVVFRIAGWSAEQALDELGARSFAIAEALPELDALRSSVGWFNSAAELERFVATVESLAAHTPATMPARRRLEVVGGS